MGDLGKGSALGGQKKEKPAGHATPPPPPTPYVQGLDTPLLLNGNVPMAKQSVHFRASEKHHMLFYLLSFTLEQVLEAFAFLFIRICRDS